MNDAVKVAFVVAFLLISLIVFIAGSDDAQKQAMTLLEADGISQLEMTGVSWFGCSDQDTFRYGFKGIKNGRHVEGVVCSGILKGATIRYTAVGQ
jgi:hypothetical protein